MAKPRLHLDADASRKDLFNALVSKGHNVTRTPASGLVLDANDEFQRYVPAVQPNQARSLVTIDPATQPKTFGHHPIKVNQLKLPRNSV